jgi:PAS domain S-box-containing protein
MFELDCSRWEIILLYLIPAGVSLAIFFYAYFFLDKKRIKAYFAFFALFLGLWQAAEGLTKLTYNAGAAHLWTEIGNTFVIIFIPLGNLFFLSLIGWNKGRLSRIISFALFAPVIVFYILMEGNYLKFQILESKDFYWISNPESDIVTTGILLWVAAGALSMLFLAGKYYYNGRTSTQKKQGRLIFSGLLFPVITGVFLEIIFPLLFHFDSFPVSASLLSIFSVTALIAIKKHKLLEYSPKHQWDNIVQSLRDSLLIIDNEGRIQYANNVFLELTGYDATEVTCKKLTELGFGIREQDSIQQPKTISKGGQRELSLRSMKGETITFLASDSPYLNSKGNVIGTIYILTNISDFKQASEVLANNESRLRQAQQVAHVGSWEINLTTKKAIWSEEACRMYGIDPKDAGNQSFETWIRRIHPDDLGDVMKVIERDHKNLSGSSFKHRIVWEDGSVRYIHSISKFEFDSSGAPKGLFGICHDITEKTEAERTLRESEENMRTFINESLLSIYFVDPSTRRILYANPALSGLLGYTDEEFRELTPYQFINHSSDDIENRIKEVMQKGKINVGERQWKRKDGKIVHVLVSSFYHNRNGTEAIYVAAQNITERKIFEQQLKETNEELKMFIYKASHDLRGPLASTLGLINVSKGEVKDPIAASYLQMIETTTQKLDYTLTELVKAMQIKDETRFTDEIKFEEIIREVLNKFSHFPKYDKLHIALNISYKEKYFSSKTILQTVIQNLIENAVKYQKSGGEKSILNVIVKGDGDKVAIVIEDNGIGIEKAVQDRIFDMYFRGTYMASGTGLGLYLVKKGVEKLNGEIILDSNFGEGTKFSVLLPMRNS